MTLRLRRKCDVRPFKTCSPFLTRYHIARKRVHTAFLPTKLRSGLVWTIEWHTLSPSMPPSQASSVSQKPPRILVGMKSSRSAILWEELLQNPFKLQSQGRPLTFRQWMDMPSIQLRRLWPPLSTQWVLLILGHITAGFAPPAINIEESLMTSSAFCYGINTGARFPTESRSGTSPPNLFFDAVIPLERVKLIGPQESEEIQAIKIISPISPCANLRRVGEDYPALHPLVVCGTRIEPKHVLLLASANIRNVKVFQKPRIGIHYHRRGNQTWRGSKRQHTGLQLSVSCGGLAELGL